MGICINYERLFIESLKTENNSDLVQNTKLFFDYSQTFNMQPEPAFNFIESKWISQKSF